MERTLEGQIIGDKNGFLKLLFRKSALRLVGVHVIGELATELVHTGLIAMMTDATPEIFIEACFNVPTLGMLYKTATLAAIDELEADPDVGFANFGNSNDGSEVSA